MSVAFRHFRPDSGRVARFWIATALMIAACSGGCVQRRLTIRSNPPGAVVYVDDYEIGTTPVSTSFIYYGKRKVQLVKDGYETVTEMRDIPAPWYEWFPLDFVTENFVPGQIRDQRCLDFTLTPQLVVPPEQLLERGEALRRGVHATSGTTPGAAAPAVRVNPPATGPGRYPAPGGPELIPTPPGVGGQPVYPLPPR
jgi:hypothetical protein